MPRQPRRRPSAGRPRRRCGASSRRPAASPGGFRVCWRPRSRRPGGSSTRPDKGDSMPVLDGQVAIVTGGGSGIGEVTAGLLAAEGAQVVICGRRPAPIDAVAKAAVRNLMEHVHNTLRNQGIRATIVMPAEVDTPILDKRPLNPDAAARASMMQAEDVARAIMLAVTLPPRTVIEEIVMSPTILRDQSRDLAVAGRAGSPDERQP